MDEIKETTGTVKAVSDKGVGKYGVCIEFDEPEEDGLTEDWFNGMKLPAGIEKGKHVKVTYMQSDKGYRWVRGISAAAAHYKIPQAKPDQPPKTKINGTFKPANGMSPMDHEKDLIALDWSWCFEYVAGVIGHKPVSDGELAGVETTFIELRRRRRQKNIY